MLASSTQHGAQRAQQRGIPPLISNWLIEYGDEEFDGRGGVIRYFSKTCIRQMERDIGRDPIKRFSEFMRCYLVERNSDGAIITVGKRYSNKHIWRH